MVSKRVIRTVLATLSILFPNLLYIRKPSKTSQKGYYSLFDQLPEYVPEGDVTVEKCEDLAELVVTLDPVTTGFRQDVLLII